MSLLILFGNLGGVDIEYAEVVSFTLRLDKVVTLNMELNKVVTLETYAELESTA